MRTSNQLKALVRNLSKLKNVEAEVILRNFMLERLLERVAVSKYKNSFILKGGMLIAAMVGIDTRTTMDLDATIKGQVLTEPEVADIVQDILNIGVDDSVTFTLRDIEGIREEADYPGYRVSIEAVLDKTRQTLKMDITTGDFVTPREIEYSFKLMLEDRTISIMAYNLETVLAEKFETVITRGIANTRMRDFYDIYVLTTTQVFDDAIFRAALKKTVEKRNTVKQMAALDEVVQTVTTSTIMASLWQRYQKKYSYAADISWEMVIHALKDLAGKADNV
ncbi:MAG: nucleotidyl transferase AbiEii/AbiGii toxin family protein [Dethiobacter sp.]|nr:nucleotidyl transferase AbiEii/AbiGii toxin family protein [Dethiobacter sp.]MBS3897874.1 nucleotidyl transferase AbiEii/AbiGii toxin family protein [Dethiobacter sp.]